MNYDFAERLIELRRQHNLSQEDLAKDLGVSRQAISKWERAESTPDVTNLGALASLYKISLDELVHGESPVAREANEPTGGAVIESAPTETSAKDTATASPELAGTVTEPAASEAPASETIEPTVTNEAPASPTPEPVANPITEAAGASTPPPPSGAPYTTTPPPPPEGTTPVQPAGTPTPQGTPKEAKKHDPLYTFPYPVLIVMVYLFLGFCFGLWHPGWVLFFTIPFYYWIVSVITHDPNYVERRKNLKR